MLQIKNISKTFNPGSVNAKKALDKVSLKLEDGDFVTVIGGNGAGKSTLLNAIAGTWLVDSGQIILDDQDVTKLAEFKRAKFLGRVFQDPMMGTAGNMQIQENLALANRRGLDKGLNWHIKPEEKEQFFELLKLLNLGLDERMTAKAGLLSGGQRQALTLLMATLREPKLLLLDEHTAALDPKTAKIVLDLTVELVKKYHPDKYQDNPLSGLAQEKLQEGIVASEAIPDRDHTHAQDHQDADDHHDPAHCPGAMEKLFFSWL